MKKILLLSCFLNAIISFSQSVPPLEWQKSFGGGSNEYNTLAIQTSDGGFISAGTTSSTNGDATGNHSNDYDILVIKTDASGNIQWKRCYGSTAVEYAANILQTNDGGYIIGGIASANNGDVSGWHGSSDYWLVKTDNLGNILWQKCYGGSGDEKLLKVKQASDGGYILAGSTFSTNGDVTDNKGFLDAWIVKTDATGTLKWEKCYGGSNYDESTDITETQNGDFIFCGNTLSSDGDLNINYGHEDMWLMRVSGINGNAMWSHSYGGSQYDYLTSITALQGDVINIAACGSTLSNDYNISGNHGSYDFGLITLDGNSGVLNSAQCYGGTGYDEANSIVNTFDKGYCISGYSSSNDGDVSGNHGGYDLWVLKLSQGGTIDWQKCLGGSNVELSFSIAETNDGGYLAGCTTYYADGDITNNYGGQDMWLVKLSPCFAPPASTAFITPNSLTCGGPVTMSVPGGIPYTYQWKKNNKNIAGAISQVYTAASSGNYTCVVSNGACGVTNSSNTISNQKQIATLSPAGTVNKCTDDLIIFTANTGNNLSYKWYRNNKEIAGETSSTYNTKKDGKYSVLVTNTNTGCTQKSGKTELINTCKENAAEQSMYQSNTTILLSQIIPNPVYSSAAISYTLPSTYAKAKIVITDIAGKVIKEYSLTGTGKNMLQINANTFSSGTYQYALYVDDKLIDSKKMLVIK